MMKGLVIIYDPHALMQFLQFYCMGDFEAEWDALCFPLENEREVMHEYCKKTAIFHRIYRGGIKFQNLSLIKKLGYFIQMLLFSILGKRKDYCKKIFNKYVDNVDKYDFFAANSENGFISGMIASFGEEKTSIYFEDGVGDYIEKREKNHSCYKRWSFQDMQCVFMAKLGYFGKGYTYLEPTKYCYKYASNPQELAYKNYKEIRKFDLTNEALNRFRNIIERVYPELILLKNRSTDSTFVFTTPLDSNNSFSEEYKRRFIEYINQHAKEIYLKRHPSELTPLLFSEQVKVHHINNNIPAEVLFSYISNNSCYMMEPDSLLINMGIYNISVIILYFDSYEQEMKKTITTWHDRKKFETFCNRFMKNRYKFLEI